jgi:hypothetical protein
MTAVAAIMLSWGVVLGVSVARGLPIATLAPKAWQRAVLGIDDGKCDYAAVERALTAYLDGPAAEQLRAIPRSRRTHPLDAAGIGVVAAVRPGEAEVIRRAVVHRDLKPANVQRKSVDEIRDPAAEVVHRDLKPSNVQQATGGST